MGSHCQSHWVSLGPARPVLPEAFAVACPDEVEIPQNHYPPPAVPAAATEKRVKEKTGAKARPGEEVAVV